MYSELKYYFIYKPNYIDSNYYCVVKTSNFGFILE